MQPITKTVSLIIIAICSILGLWYYLNPIFQPKPLALHNATIIPSAPTISEFNLIDTNNASFTANNLRGRWTLLFFGYTDCPDICPSTLTIMRDTWNKFNSYPANFVFVNINPNSNNPAEVKDFLQRFHPDFIGVTGTSDAVKQLSNQLGVFANLANDNAATTTAATTANNNTSNNATTTNGTADNKVIIDHTAALMLINPHGKLYAILTPPFDPLLLAEDLVEITKSNRKILK